MAVYIKGLFDNLDNRDRIVEKSSEFSDEYLLQKCDTVIVNTKKEYKFESYLSDLIHATSAQSKCSSDKITYQVVSLVW